MTKRDGNWTDFGHPCFDEYDADPMSMTRDEFIAATENIMDCDCFEAVPRGQDGHCDHKVRGGTWATCSSGGLSRHCPDSIRPKEASNGSG